LCQCQLNGDKARYWAKIAVFIPHLHSMPALGGLRRNIAIMCGTDKLKWCGYPKVRKVWVYV